MNRGTRTLIVLVVALLAAAGASYGVYAAIRSMPERRVEIATRNAVVAKRQLPVGTRLTSDDLKVVQWPEKTPVQGAFAEVAQVVDRGLISGVVENEPIIESKLAAKEAGAGLAPTITPGMRAITIGVNERIGVAGFVVPGSRVDVIAVISRSNKEPVSRVVVSNVQVLTAGTRYDQEQAKDGKPIRSTVVTLLVTPLDQDRIALAQTEGQLVLTLRHPLDVQPTETTGVSAGELFGEKPVAPVERPAVRRPRVVEPPPPAPVVAPPAPYLIENIKAGKPSTTTLKEGAEK
jgi:pilus assembly protein CpaB